MSSRLWVNNGEVNAASIPNYEVTFLISPFINSFVTIDGLPRLALRH